MGKHKMEPEIGVVEEATSNVDPSILTSESDPSSTSPTSTTKIDESFIETSEEERAIDQSPCKVNSDQPLGTGIRDWVEQAKKLLPLPQKETATGKDIGVVVIENVDLFRARPDSDWTEALSSEMGGKHVVRLSLGAYGPLRADIFRYIEENILKKLEVLPKPDENWPIYKRALGDDKNNIRKYLSTWSPIYLHKMIKTIRENPFMVWSKMNAETEEWERKWNELNTKNENERTQESQDALDKAEKEKKLAKVEEETFLGKLNLLQTSPKFEFHRAAQYGELMKLIQGLRGESLSEVELLKGVNDDFSKLAEIISISKDEEELCCKGLCKASGGGGKHCLKQKTMWNGDVPLKDLFDKLEKEKGKDIPRACNLLITGNSATSWCKNSCMDGTKSSISSSALQQEDVNQNPSKSTKVETETQTSFEVDPTSEDQKDVKCREVDPLVSKMDNFYDFSWGE